MFCTFLNNIQPSSSNFFTSIGKPAKGTFLGITRQLLCLMPLIIVLPRFFGIDGLMFAGPIADFLAAAIAVAMLIMEHKDMHRLEAGHE